MSSEKENKVKKTFSIDPDIYRKFVEKCGMIPYSRQVELLMKNWIDGVSSVPIPEEEIPEVKEVVKVVSRHPRKQRKIAQGE